MIISCETLNFFLFFFVCVASCKHGRNFLLPVAHPISRSVSCSNKKWHPINHTLNCTSSTAYCPKLFLTFSVNFIKFVTSTHHQSSLSIQANLSHSSVQKHEIIHANDIISTIISIKILSTFKWYRKATQLCTNGTAQKRDKMIRNKHNFVPILLLFFIKVFYCLWNLLTTKNQFKEICISFVSFRAPVTHPSFNRNKMQIRVILVYSSFFYLSNEKKKKLQKRKDSRTRTFWLNWR